jgi:methylenetetrahydrofolate reductase (NADPH)
MESNPLSTSAPERSSAASEAMVEHVRIAALARGASLEISARDATDLAECAECLDPGTELFVSLPPGQPYHGAVAMAVRARRAGFVPVPHVTARSLASLASLEDYLARAAGDAGVDRVLVIGGDRDRPAGPFDSSLSVLCTGALQKHGIKRVGIAGYPEGHPTISPRALHDALLAKKQLARESGIGLEAVTQFCFDAGPIVSWVARMRGFGQALRIGLAGPASITTLLKFATRCGVGNSARALKSRSGSIIRLITEAGPEAVVRDLARGFAQAPDFPPVSLHLFTFGGLLRSAHWLRAVREGNFEILPAQPGFQTGKAV